MKPSSYYEMVNSHLLALIPPSAKAILDIGCGAGALGAAIRARGQEARIVGVEISEEQAKRAEEHLDRVLCGDIVREFPFLMSDSFDCVICGDVLEHLPDPASALSEARRVLKPDGCLVASIPNVAHWSVVEGLLRGEWEYQEAGILDDTHLRFFTEASFGRVLTEAGFEDWSAYPVSIAQNPPPAEIDDLLGALGINEHAFGQQANTYQWLFVARPEAPPPPLTSIVVPAHNLWEQTLACLESIRLYTHVPYEVILIDNGSSDTARHAMLTYADSDRHSGVFVTSQPGNLPYAQACNRGVCAAEGECVILLNNDTIVTEGWLSRMLEVLKRYPAAGVVGPMSNYVAGCQKVPVPYSEVGEKMHEFASAWAGAHKDETAQVASVIGFCMLIRKDAWEAVGGMDERFINGYEETDLCLRLAQLGHDTRIARSVFIHHEGSQTFKELGADPQEPESAYWTQIDENWGRFKEKWGVPEAMAAPEGLAWLLRKVGSSAGPPSLFWAVLFERAMLWEGADSLLDIAAAAGIHGFSRLSYAYTATDNARNEITRMFLALAGNPNDTLIMLDSDHLADPEILLQLGQHQVGVVGALAFRRGVPYDPIFYMLREDGELEQPASFPDGLLPCTAVGSGAIAIKRWVFDELSAQGHRPPFWRLRYIDDMRNRSGEELYFAELCARCGIRHHVDTTIEIPHLITTMINRDVWDKYREKHPELIEGKSPEGESDDD